MHGGNDIAWRCEYPAEALGARTEIVPEKDMDLRIMFPHNRGPMQWHLQLSYADGHRQTITTKGQYRAWMKANPDWTRSVVEAKAVFPKHEGAAVWIRPDIPRAGLAESMRAQHGWRTLAEVDDNYLTKTKLSLYLRESNWDSNDQFDHLNALCSMDGVVFSTDLLRDRYVLDMRRHVKEAGKKYGRKYKGPELHVCRNHVPERHWPERVETDGPVRVGWMGSSSHVWDVNLAWAAMLYAKQNGAETWMIGYNPVTDPIASVPTLNGKPMLSAKSQFNINQWFKVGFRHVPWREPEQYERLPLPLDIGLCPITTDEMTLGKSDVKAIEYTISGAAVIAMNNPVYNRDWINGETALLVGSPAEMLDATKVLMRDTKLRETLVANAQQYVRENRSDQQLRDEWTAAVSG